MSRDELLKIFNSYAMPLHKRSSTRTKITDQQMHTMELTAEEQANKTGNKHKLVVYESSLQPNNKRSNNSKSMDLVTNGCKKIKIGVTNSSTSDNKRGIQDLKIDTSQKPKRQKITWP